ncbi:MAG: zinc-ribbon domain-containing protein [Ruminococcus sp.]|jgi:hypothetical protein|nr:zinc-ribbon domain-containing protein [Ruminococcus sp.]
MKLLNTYEEFKENCEEFSALFDKTFFTEADYLCHPTLEGVLITPASDDEVKNFSADICRMSDMMLMSENASDWKAFNLAEARQISSANGSVYLTDLNAEADFEAEDWMINGKNDTVIVSVAYMKEKGKRYAPVTPLTNRLLHYKKVKNDFFWRGGDITDISVLNKDIIKERLDSYFKECCDTCPKIKYSEKNAFPLFDLNVMIDVNTNRIKQVNLFFEKIEEIVNTLTENAPFIESSGVKFSVHDFLTDLCVNALNSDGIQIEKNVFVSDFFAPLQKSGPDAIDEKADCLPKKNPDPSVDCIKLAYIDAITKLGGMGFTYISEDEGKYIEEMHKIEMGDIDRDEEKFLIASLLSKKPKPGIFIYVSTRYPEEAEHMTAIRDYWGFTGEDRGQLIASVIDSYITDADRNGDGSFAMPLDKAKIIFKNLSKVLKKYGEAASEVLLTLDEYIKAGEITARTYNGTVFDTEEAAREAVKAELDVKELCDNLSALTRTELKNLRRYIMDLTLDRSTKAKYLVKIKTALNNSDQSELEQITLGLPLAGIAECEKMLGEITDGGFDTVIARKFTDKINAKLFSLRCAAAADSFADIQNMNMSELNSAESSLKNIADKFIKRHYAEKIDNAKSRILKDEIKNLSQGYEDLDKKSLFELAKKLSDVDKYPERLTYKILSKINKFIEAFDANQVKKLFSGIENASMDDLERIQKSANEYDIALTAEYLPKINERRNVLLDEELLKITDGVEDADEKKLTEIKDTLNKQREKFNLKSIEKQYERITMRENELKGSEIATLCKPVSYAEKDELSEIKAKLTNGSFEDELIKPYLSKILEREKEILRDEMFESIGDIAAFEDLETIEKQIAELRDSEKYAEFAPEAIERLETRRREIKSANFKIRLGKISEMTETELNEITAELAGKASEFRSDEIDKIHAQIDSRLEELDAIALSELESSIEDLGIEESQTQLEALGDGRYSYEQVSGIISKLKKHIDYLFTVEMDKITQGIGEMSKLELSALIEEVSALPYPDDIKTRYIRMIERKITNINEAEIEAIIGHISILNEKQATDIIRRITLMKTDEDLKTRYIDKLEAHIIKLREEEAQKYVAVMQESMRDFAVTPAMLCIPGNALFPNKVDIAADTYASIGRYEQALAVTDVQNSDEASLLTTDYLYCRTKSGTISRTKIDDIEEIKVKKTLLSASMQCRTKTETFDVPNGFDKKNLDAIAKILTEIIVIIKDKHSVERLKQIEANSAKQPDPFESIPGAATAKIRSKLDNAESAENTDFSEPIPSLSPKSNHEQNRAEQKSDSEPAYAQAAKAVAELAEFAEIAKQRAIESIEIPGSKISKNSSAQSEPVQTEPAPSEPAPTEPAPSEPAPSEPAPSESAPSEQGKHDEDVKAEAAEKAETVKTEHNVKRELDDIGAELAALTADLDNSISRVEPVKVKKPNGKKLEDVSVPVSPISVPVSPISVTVIPTTTATPTVTSAEHKEPKPKFCSECGAKITSATAKFCAECGARLVI